MVMLLVRELKDDGNQHASSCGEYLDLSSKAWPWKNQILGLGTFHPAQPLPDEDPDYRYEDDQLEAEANDLELVDD